MIPQETVQAILDTAQIVDVVSDFVTLKKRGSDWVACCPFHNEKTPSFHVSPSKGFYKCFGCGKGGTAVSFVMEHEHCSYAEALRYLAKKYHIEIVEKELSAEEIARNQRNESLLLVSEFAQKFFAEQLSGGEGRDVGLAYYKSRALEDETIAKFGLGWAPGGKDKLLQAARAAGYKDEYLLDAGLVTRKEDGSLVDKFRERVVFPIQSVSGRVIAFSGRTLRSDNPAKYLNSPDTPIYTKSNILFGIWFAKSEIARKDKCIVVEGNVDLVMLHQLGIRNVVAPCGTSFTEKQIQLIRRFSNNITLMFDGDNAGVHAAERAIDMILDEGMNVRIVRLPKDDDPDSFARSHSLEEYNDFIDSHEQDFLDFKIDLLLADSEGNPTKKAEGIGNITNSIAHITDSIKRSVYSQGASTKLGIELDIITESVEKIRRKILDDKLKEQQRRERQRELAAGSQGGPETAPPPSYEPYPGEPGPEGFETAPVPSDDVPEDREYVPECKILAPIEKDILFFVLKYGLDILDFPSDSNEGQEFKADPVTVTEYVSDYLDLHEIVLENSGYKRLYEAYLAEYDAGYEQMDIVHHLMDSPDRLVASLAASIYISRYELTVKGLKSSMTTHSTWLVTNVPNTMYKYQVKRIEKQIWDLKRSLPGLESGVEEVLAKIMTLQEEQKKLKKQFLDKNE